MDIKLAAGIFHRKNNSQPKWDAFFFSAGNVAAVVVAVAVTVSSSFIKSRSVFYGKIIRVISHITL